MFRNLFLCVKKKKEPREPLHQDTQNNIQLRPNDPLSLDCDSTLLIKEETKFGSNEIQEFLPNVREREDFLSFSHSLIDILCHVDRKDILNCKLVSRRLNEVIQKNDKNLPRTKARLKLSFENTGEKFSTVTAEVHISNRKEWNCILSDLEPYQLEFCSDRLSQLIRSSIEDMNELVGGTNSPDGCPTNRTIFKELRAFLKVLFHRYYFANMIIEHSNTAQQDQEEFYSVIGDVFRTSRSKCRNLCVSAMSWRHLKTMCKKMACEYLSLCNMNDVHSELLSFSTRVQCTLFVEMASAAHLNLPLICEMVKIWEAGSSANILTLESNGQNKPRAQEICFNLMSLPWYNMSCHTEEDRMWRMKFRRPMDDRILCLSYSYEYSESDFPCFSEYFDILERPAQSVYYL